LPLTATPDLPDITVTEVYINNNPAGNTAYKGETTWIDFQISNMGTKSTILDDYWFKNSSPTFAFSVYVDDQVINDDYGAPIENRKVAQSTNWYLNNSPPDVLDVNQSLKITGINYNFDHEGYHEIKIRVGYLEFKGLSQGSPVYGIGDLNRGNNTIIHGIYVHPPRGTVIGKIQTNPCVDDCGVNGIKVCLRNTSGGDYNECMLSGYDSGQNLNGVYRFVNVPTGDYMLEFLPDKPTPEERAQGAPYYTPRRFTFHHNENDTDNFINTTGMWLQQYQVLKGKVVKEDNTAFQGVEVSLGEFGTVKTITDANGEFTFNDILPGREYKLYFRHPLYKTKAVSFNLYV
jgi:hypothetical protein